MKNFKEVVRSLLFAVLLIASSMQMTGCFALFVGAAAASGVVWIKGRLQQNVDAPLDRVHSATVAGLKRLSLPVISDKKDKARAKVESEYSDGKHVWVQLDYLTKNATRITIRVGTLGDEPRSREILDNIMRNL